MPLIKPLKNVFLCALLMGCSSGQVVTTQFQETKPDPTWVAAPKTPIRSEDTFGGFYWWSFDLYFMHCKNAIERQAARDYFGFDSASVTVNECLEEFSREQLEKGQLPSKADKAD